MRLKTRLVYFAPLLAGLALADSITVGAAFAGNLYQEQVHADSFGNLVIYSPAGYKRIVVGEGHLAEALQAAQAEVARPRHDRGLPYHEHPRYGSHCNRQPVVLRGRSHMYGLPDRVIPVPAGICR